MGWGDFRASHPGWIRADRPDGDGINPYRCYDSASSPFLYGGPETSGELHTMVRVLTIDAGEDAVAYTYQVAGGEPGGQ